MLYVGKLNPECERIAKLVVSAEIGKARNTKWLKCRKNIDAIDNLNLASVCVFNDAVRALEGIDPKSRKAQKQTKFPNLPWWMYCIWLPLDFTPPKEPLTDETGFPVFVGSCPRLLEELTRIQQQSKLKLGTVPAGYEQMREDLRAFYKSEFEVKGKKAIIQWVWQALFDAATIAMREDAPLWGAND